MPAVPLLHVPVHPLRSGYTCMLVHTPRTDGTAGSLSIPSIPLKQTLPQFKVSVLAPQAASGRLVLGPAAPAPLPARRICSLPLCAPSENAPCVLAKQTFAALLVITPTHTHLHTHAARTQPTTYRNGMRARTKWITPNVFASWKRSYGRWRPIAKRRSHLSNWNLRKARRLPQCWTVMMKRMRSEAEREACMLPLAMASNADRVQGKDGVSPSLALLSPLSSLSLSHARAHTHPYSHPPTPRPPHTFARSLALRGAACTLTRSPHYLFQG